MAMRRGQILVWFALLLPILALLLVGAADYAISARRVLDTAMAADLAAHAAAQAVVVRFDGRVAPAPEAPLIAERVFWANAPAGAWLESVRCDMATGRPRCVVRAGIRTAGWLGIRERAEVTGVGYLAVGATRGDQ
jgi:Tfp pilus assembly protein PilX